MTMINTLTPARRQSRRRATALAILFSGLAVHVSAAPRNPLTDTQPPRFIRYWAPFEQCGNVFGAYTSVTLRDGQLEFWHAMLADDPLRPDDQSRNVDVLAVRRGPSLAELGPAQIVLEMRDIIDDVPRLDGQPGLAPGRSFSRTYVTRDDEFGYVGLVCAHPEYKSHYLHPALIVSPTGAPGTWRYLGKLKGEPADEVARRRVWSDGGTILRLSDKRWRIYTNGYGEWNGLVALEADTLEGPWKFLRDAEGRVRMLTPNIPTAGGQCLGIFPNVLRVSDTDWHAWLSDRWIPDTIGHFHSVNGLDWKLYGRQPEIVRAEDEDYIKCIRSFVSPDGAQIIGLLSVAMKDDGSSGHTPWVAHWSRMPVGPPPVIRH
jgi:hypothetical protein